MLVGGVFNTDNKSDGQVSLPQCPCQMPQAHLALIWCFVRALLSEPGFSGLSDFQDYRFWTLVAPINATGASSVDSPNL